MEKGYPAFDAGPVVGMVVAGTGNNAASRRTPRQAKLQDSHNVGTDAVLNAFGVELIAREY